MQITWTGGLGITAAIVVIIFVLVLVFKAGSRMGKDNDSKGGSTNSTNSTNSSNTPTS